MDTPAPAPTPVTPPTPPPQTPAPTPAPVTPTTPPQTPPPAMKASTPQPIHHTLRTILITTGLLVVALAFAGGVYAYSNGLLPPLPFLNHAPYSSEHFFEGVSNGFTKIQNSTYTSTINLKSEPRDPDAVPFVTNDANSLAMQRLAAYIPADIAFTFSVGGTTQHVDSAINARAVMSADLTSTNLSMAFAAEIRKVQDTIYVNISKFPVVFFSPIAGILNQWIAITPDDAKKFGLNVTAEKSLTDEQKAKVQQKLESIIHLADVDHALQVAGSPTRESLDGTQVYRYDLNINPDTFTAFYEDTLNTLSTTTAGRPDASLTYLRSDDGKRFLAYLSQNMVFHLWADTSGIPRKFEMSMRVVPPDTATNVKDKQLRVLLDVVMSDINTPVTIDAPSPTISVDAAEKLLYGSQTMITNTTSTKIPTNNKK